MMDVQHEDLPNGFAVTFIDEATKQRYRYVADLQDKEIVKGLENQGWMHWLPMTHDAVFEDGGAYLVESVHDGLLFAVEYGGYDAKFHLPLDVIEPFSTKDISHYARITEPK